MYFYRTVYRINSVHSSVFRSCFSYVIISTVVFCDRTCKGEELPMILESAQIIIIATIAIYLMSMVLVGVYFSKKGSSGS